MQTRGNGNPNPRRGDLYWLDWYPARGSEQAGRRPGVVITTEAINRTSPVVIVAAVTSRISYRTYRFHVRVPLASSTGLTRESTVLCEQLMTVSKDRLKEYIGTLTPELLDQVDSALKIALDLN